MKEIKRSAPAHRDFELDIDRRNPVRYEAVHPERGRADGLVFCIPGCVPPKQAKSYRPYFNILRRYIADKYNLIAVTVEYHAFNNRPEFGAKIWLDPMSILQNIGRLSLAGCRIEPDPKNPHAILDDQDKFISAVCDLPLDLVTKGELAPPNDEYQDFGILQALDHLAVLNDLVFQGADFNRTNIVCLGTSHGAYVANMISKLAPNTVSLVIDNSSYLAPQTDYFGKNGAAETVVFLSPTFRVELNTRTKWQFEDDTDPAFFGPARYAIRDVANIVHIGEAAEQAERNCRYRMISSEIDPISPIDRKRRHVAVLNANGYESTLEIVRDDDIDGDMLKTTEHGLGASLNGLFDRYYSHPSTPRSDAGVEPSTVRYTCYDMIYEITHDMAAGVLEASCARVW